jgi:hypothetical protein
MCYLANHLIRSDLERAIHQAIAPMGNYMALSRPNRKHLFPQGYRLEEGEYVPEFFRPAPIVITRKADPSKRAVLVCEIDGIGIDLDALYRRQGIPWIEVRTDASGLVLTCTQATTRMTVQEPSGRLAGGLAACLALAEASPTPAGGKYIHSYSERVLREAVDGLAPTLGVACHHQVPVGFVLGHVSDLTPDEKRLLGCDIDAVVTPNFASDPDATVVLPVKIDLHESHSLAQVAERDRRIRDLFARNQVPLLVVTPAEKGCHLECGLLGTDVTVARLDPASWADALVAFVAKALRHANRI